MVREQISWIDPNGIETILTGQPQLEVAIGAKGRFMPEFDLIDQQVPLQPGSRLKQINVKPRIVDLPIEVMGNSTSDLRTQIRNLLNTFNPLKGDGTLKVVAEDGTQRLLTCRYSGGLEGQEIGLPWLNMILIFKAFDPFWYDANTIVNTYTIGTPANFFPFFPLRLTSSTVFTDTTITNSGDVATSPQWIINGPGDTIFLRNLTTGEFINLNTSLGVGESITIDARRGKKTVTKNNGDNLYSSLSSDSSLWQLQPDTNQIRIEMQNATSASSVQISYQNKYWGA